LNPEQVQTCKIRLKTVIFHQKNMFCLLDDEEEKMEQNLKQARCFSKTHIVACWDGGEG